MSTEEPLWDTARIVLKDGTALFFSPTGEEVSGEEFEAKTSPEAKARLVDFLMQRGPFAPPEVK